MAASAAKSGGGTARELSYGESEVLNLISDKKAEQNRTGTGASELHNKVTADLVLKLVEELSALSRDVCEVSSVRQLIELSTIGIVTVPVFCLLYSAESHIRLTGSEAIQR
ncbi:hypothetical protein V6N12_009755 [Hibiscus sabdariffa]|uniref:Uncharacterized protein n=1 Tax=Hibiscus sabdariffa TaxID=183260 RepID=A0ABR2A3Y0_9ROSI